MNGCFTRCDKKRADMFVLAMMGGSYFADAPSEIRGMGPAAIDYAEMGKAEQERREQEVIRAFEEFGETFLSIFEELRCAVYACTTENSSCIWFRTGFEEVVLCMGKDGYVTDARIVHGWQKKDWDTYIKGVRKKEEKEKEAEEKRKAIREQKMKFLSKNGLLKCRTYSEKLEDGNIRVVFSGKGRRAVYTYRCEKAS